MTRQERRIAILAQINAKEIDAQAAIFVRMGYTVEELTIVQIPGQEAVEVTLMSLMVKD